jgi:hypothetical protein
VDFEITPNPNFIIGEFDSEDRTVSEALDKKEVNDRYFTMKWKDTLLELNYGMCITESVRDIVRMLDSIKKGESRCNMIFPSQAFCENWECKIFGKNITIKWLGREEYNDITVDSDLFTKEWLKLLYQFRVALIETGYSSNSLVDFYLLENIEQYLS